MKIDIDFQVYDSKDPKSFIVIDTSNWEHIHDKPSIIEITIPGDEHPVTNYYAKRCSKGCGVNVFDSYSLGLMCEGCGDEKIDLPDGIYDITVKGSPDKFRKSKAYLRTTKLQLDLDKLYIDLSLECFNSEEELQRKIDKLNKIQLLIKAAEANVRHDHRCIAHDLFRKAYELLNKAKKCNGCI